MLVTDSFSIIYKWFVFTIIQPNQANIHPVAANKFFCCQWLFPALLLINKAQ